MHLPQQGGGGVGGGHDGAHVEALGYQQARGEQLDRGAVRHPAPARQRPHQDQHARPGDRRLPGEIALPAVGEPGAENALRARLPGALDERGQFAVDGDLGKLEPRPYRAGEPDVGRQALAEQVDLARAGQAQVRRRRAHLDHLAGHGDRLHRRHLQCHRDRAARQHHEQHQPSQPAQGRRSPLGRPRTVSCCTHALPTLATGCARRPVPGPVTGPPAASIRAGYRAPAPGPATAGRGAGRPRRPRASW